PQPLVHRTLQITRPVEKTADERMATYAMFSLLISQNEVHNAAENACHSVRALEVVALYELISRVEFLPDVRLHFAVLFIGDFCRVVFNAFGWQKWSPEADNESKLEHVTHVQCLVASLVNHNCDCISTPWEFTAAGMITFFANRDIKSGKQITISYGTCPAMPYHQRQKRLNDYYFACAVCSACFADASKYAVLRCGASPTGAVPIQTVINQEDLSKNSKVSKREVDKQEISLLNLWFDLSTALLEQCDDHQKLLFLAVALGTKMNHLLKNLVDFGFSLDAVYKEGAPLSPRNNSVNPSPEEKEKDENFGAGQSDAPNQASGQEEEEVKVEENVADVPPMVDDDGGVLVDAVAASTVGLVQQQVAVPVVVTKEELYSSSSSSSSDKNDKSDDDDVPVFQSLEQVEGVPPPPMPTLLQDESELSAVSSLALPTLAASMPGENIPPAAAAAIPVKNIFPAAAISVENIPPVAETAAAAPKPVENILPAMAAPMPVKNIPQAALAPAIPAENLPLTAAAILVENIPPATANTQNFVQQHPAASVPSFKSLFLLAASSQPIGF
ncbi:hypothetical protein TYRP_008570, partial [Tyrophagus putrescentiae]